MVSIPDALITHGNVVEHGGGQGQAALHERGPGGGGVSAATTAPFYHLDAL